MITYTLPDQFIDNSRLYLVQNPPLIANFLGNAQPTLYTFSSYLNFDAVLNTVEFNGTGFLNILTTPTEYDSESPVVIPNFGQIYVWPVVANSNIDVPLNQPLSYYQL